MSNRSNIEQSQRGFTLIELMIVVTIVGILASIGVPIYRDYTIRTRVGECASVFSTLKTETSVWYSEMGVLPADLATLASKGRVSGTPTDYVGDYVYQIDIVDGDVICSLGSDSALGGASAGHITFNSSVDGGTAINWTVESSDIAEKYLPAINLIGNFGISLLINEAPLSNLHLRIGAG